MFHSVPYLVKGDPSSLEYWEFDKLGTKASLGCIRLQVKDAKWIYENITKGTIVEFYSSNSLESLGKPSAPIISSNESCRNWDPTDLSEGNPWLSSSTTTNNTNTITNADTNTNITVNNTTSSNNTSSINNTNSSNDVSNNLINTNTSVNSNVVNTSTNAIVNNNNIAVNSSNIINNQIN